MSRRWTAGLSFGIVGTVSAIAVGFGVSYGVWRNGLNSVTRAHLYRNQWGQWSQILDARLGWVNNPKGGIFKHVYQLGDRSVPITVTLLPGGERVTSASPIDLHDTRPQVLTIGCSFTFGWAVNDDETYPWALQTVLPELRVRNLGIGGYGTYQSLLWLEQVFGSQPKSRQMATVVYGLIDDHCRRNTGQYDWVTHLARFNQAKLAIPYCRLDSDGQLLRFQPRGVVQLAAQHYDLSLNESQHVTERLIVEMDHLSRAHGARFILAYLGGTQQAQWRQLCEQYQVEWCDARPQQASGPLYSEYEDHPSQYFHWSVAENVAACLRKSVARIGN